MKTIKSIKIEKFFPQLQYYSENLLNNLPRQTAAEQNLTFSIKSETTAKMNISLFAMLCGACTAQTIEPNVFNADSTTSRAEDALNKKNPHKNLLK